VVICEGLYLLHDDDQWDLHECFDFSIFIDSDVDKAMSRLKSRNQVIPGYTPEEIDCRVDLVDRVNAHSVNLSKSRASLVVQSTF
jgi:pantothenate kinase